MKTANESTKILEEVNVNVKIKLSALWITVMFLFLYVDHFALFKPEVIEQIIAGKVWTFQITQAWALGSMLLMTIPILMIFLTLTLRAKANRWLNIIVGILYLIVVVGNTIGESWAFYIFGSIVEIVFLALIIWYARKWPNSES